MFTVLSNLVINILSGIGNFFSELFTVLGNLFNNLLSGTGNFFSDLFTRLGDWFTNIGNFLTSIVSYINPFSENFFVYKLIDLLFDLLTLLFVPSSDYFSNKFDNLKANFANRLSYQSYLDIFENTKNIVANEQISIDLNNYSVGSLNLSKSKFIDFSVFDKYKSTYYGWVRGFTFIFLVLYIINHWYKLIRGVDLINMSNFKGGQDK